MLTKKKKKNLCVCNNVCQLKTFNKSIGLYNMNKKFRAKPTEGESMQYKKKYETNIGLLKHGYPVTSSWQFKKMCKVSTFEFPCRQCRRQDFWDPFSSTTSEWEGLPWFPMNCPSWTVARCGTADSDSVMVNAWWCSTTFSSYILGILEQLVSGTVNGRRWTNSIECSFLWFKSLGFLSLWITKVYCLC